MTRIALKRRHLLMPQHSPRATLVSDLRHLAEQLRPFSEAAIRLPAGMANNEDIHLGGHAIVRVIDCRSVVLAYQSLLDEIARRTRAAKEPS